MALYIAIRDVTGGPFPAGTLTKNGVFHDNNISALSSAVEKYFHRITLRELYKLISRAFVGKGNDAILTQAINNCKKDVIQNGTIQRQKVCELHVWFAQALNCLDQMQPYPMDIVTTFFNNLRPNIRSLMTSNNAGPGD